MLHVQSTPIQPEEVQQQDTQVAFQVVVASSGLVLAGRMLHQEGCHHYKECIGSNSALVHLHVTAPSAEMYREPLA